MAQSKKKGTNSQSVEKALSAKTTDKNWKWNWQRFIIASVVIILMAATVGIFYYQNNVAPFRRTIITVDDTTIDMGYFIKRARISGVAPITLLTALTDEQLIKLGAPQYVEEVSPEDIDEALRMVAQGESETISESEFKEWYRQQLNEIGLSDSEYREIVGTSLVTARLHTYLVERMPTIAEQIHLNAITLETYEDAQKVRIRWEAGEDFANLARETSLDEESKQNGGDLGWFPRGVLPIGLEYEAFNLGTDNVSEPVPYDSSEPSLNPGQPAQPKIVYYLFMISEKADARQVDDIYLPVLGETALEGWLMAEREFHEIRYNFNSEISAWINWQLAKQ